MKKQAGFTLIELVIVIIILGILAVTAAPKFLNLQDDARNSTLKGMQGSLNSADAMVYSKAVIAGLEKTAGPVSLPLDAGKNVMIKWGYPEGTSTALSTVAEINTADWQFGGTSNTDLRIYPKAADMTAKPDECYVSYKEAANASTPPVVTTSACK